MEPKKGRTISAPRWTHAGPRRFHFMAGFRQVFVLTLEHHLDFLFKRRDDI